MLPFVGQIVLFPYDFAPAGWLFCDGALLPISENEYLFQRLGNTFGGDGESTFGLPDLTAKAPTGCHYCISPFGVFVENVHESYIGETLPLPTNMTTPGNLLPCAGQSVSKTQYWFLEKYIGNRFGGDANNFNLPKLSNLLTDYQYVIATSGTTPEFPGNRGPYVGELILLPYNQTFQGETALLLCNGAMLPVQQHTALYSLIGNKFGGNNQQFALPNLASAVPANYSFYLSPTGVFPQRS